MKVVLYGRRGCHLCEAAEDAVAVVVPDAVVVAIDGRPDLERAFGQRVPVLEVDGEIVAEGRIDESAVRAVLDRRGGGGPVRARG